jgi:hypothetical protein
MQFFIKYYYLSPLIFSSLNINVIHMCKALVIITVLLLKVSYGSSLALYCNRRVVGVYTPHARIWQSCEGHKTNMKSSAVKSAEKRVVFICVE